MEAAAEENLESLKRKRVVFGESQLVSNKGLRKVYREFSYQLQGLATGSEVSFQVKFDTLVGLKHVNRRRHCEN